MRRFLPTLFLLAIVGGGAYLYRDQVYAAAHQVYAQFSPCTSPLTYKIGTIDPQFNLSKKQFVAAIDQASQIWEKGSKKNLFAYDQDAGIITVSLVYDYRQRAIDKLQSLGFTIDSNQSSYDGLKSKYNSLQSDYGGRKASFESSIKAFQSEQDAYNQEVQKWNAHGGAPRDVFNQLQAQKSSLATEQSQLQHTQDILNDEVDEINALATTLNGLAKTLNIEAANYNQIGASTGGEFEEGVYESRLGEQKIDIFEFSNNAELTRVLAHELGHALGLNHVDDKNAIMYKLNQSSNDRLTTADYKELTRVCKFK